MSINHYLTNVDLNARIREKCDITVATLADRDALLTWRRKWSMIVGVYDDPDAANNTYYSLKYDQNSTDLADNDNWVLLETDPVAMAAIGDRVYTEENYIADGETITASLDKLDQAVKDNELTYVSQLGALIWK